MLVALGENDIKTVEDLAGCATDDLVGWTERKDGEAIRYAGALDGFELSREEAEAIVMAARVKAGWIEAGGRRAGGGAGQPESRGRSREAARREARKRVDRPRDPDHAISRPTTHDPRKHPRIAAPRAGTHLHRHPRGRRRPRP